MPPAHRPFCITPGPPYFCMQHQDPPVVGASQAVADAICDGNDASSILRDQPAPPLRIQKAAVGLF